MAKWNSHPIAWPTHHAFAQPAEWSEREAALWLRDESRVIGGWLSSLTLNVGLPEDCYETAMYSPVRSHAGIIRRPHPVFGRREANQRYGRHCFRRFPQHADCLGAVPRNLFRRFRSHQHRSGGQGLQSSRGLWLSQGDYSLLDHLEGARLHFLAAEYECVPLLPAARGRA